MRAARKIVGMALGSKTKRSAAKRAKKGGRKKARSQAQKAATARMLAGLAAKRGGRAAPKRARKGRKSNRGVIVSSGPVRNSRDEQRLSHVEKKVNEHGREIGGLKKDVSVLKSQEKRMRAVISRRAPKLLGSGASGSTVLAVVAKPRRRRKKAA